MDASPALPLVGNSGYMHRRMHFARTHAGLYRLLGLLIRQPVPANCSAAMQAVVAYVDSVLEEAAEGLYRARGFDHGDLDLGLLILRCRVRSLVSRVVNERAPRPARISFATTTALVENVSTSVADSMSQTSRRVCDGLSEALSGVSTATTTDLLLPLVGTTWCTQPRRPVRDGPTFQLLMRIRSLGAREGGNAVSQRECAEQDCGTPENQGPQGYVHICRVIDESKSPPQILERRARIRRSMVVAQGTVCAGRARRSDSQLRAHSMCGHPRRPSLGVRRAQEDILWHDAKLLQFDRGDHLECV